MKYLNLLLSSDSKIAPVVLRAGLAIVMFPHGAQKLLGWFGGYGFSGTMQFFTESMGIPAPFALLAILTEFFAPLLLIAGLATRAAALFLGGLITVAALKVHVAHGFFMNWSGQQEGEGIEYHILFAVIALALVITGSGRWAIDNILVKKLADKN